MATRQWWERPQLWTDAGQEEGHERRVSWLELFSDLIFVVVIAELAHYLVGHISWGGVAGYVLLFIPAWWNWIGGTFYNERFETHDISYRVLTFLQILAVAALAIFVHDGLGATSRQFALAYAASRVLITIMWLRGGRHAPIFRPVSTRYAIGFSLSILLFVISVAVPAPWRFGLWGLGLLIDLVTPMTTLHLQARLPRARLSKLPERFGLFVIIVLGEAVVGVIQGVAAGGGLTATEVATLALGLALVFGLWWVYFDYVGRRLSRPGVWWRLGWGYLHLPLVMGIAAIGAAVQSLLAPHDGALGAGAFWLLAGALATALASIALIEATLAPDPHEPTEARTSIGLKLGGAVAALALGALGGALGPIPLLGTLLLLLLVQMLYGAYVWFTRPTPELVPER